jgi:vacuolar-type H+-ATPase subunit H
VTEKSPEQIRQEIDRTRAQLSGDVQTLTEKVSPGQAMGRQVRRTRHAMTRAKERVMGSNSSSDEGMLSSAASSVQDAAGSVAQAASSAPDAARRQTQGNPIAAGLIAFGAGWLVSSILPASQPEQRLAAQAKEKAEEVAKPVMEQAKQAGQEMAENLKEPAKHAVDEVRSTAQDAASTVTEQAKQSAADVKDEARA